MPLSDFALVTMLGLLGLRICEATGAHVTDLGEVRGHRVLTILGKADKFATVPLPPAVGRAIDRATNKGRCHRPPLAQRAGVSSSGRLKPGPDRRPGPGVGALHGAAQRPRGLKALGLLEVAYAIGTRAAP